MEGDLLPVWVRTKDVSRQGVDVFPALFSHSAMEWEGKHVVGDICCLFVGVKSCDGYGVNVVL